MMTDDDLIEAFSAYQRNRAFSEATVKRRVTSLTSLRRHIAPVDLTGVTLELVEDWLGTLGKPRTIHAYKSDASSFYKWALKRSLVLSNPCALLDPVRVPKAVPKPAPPEAIAVAMARSDGDTQVMILLAALAGLRIGDIAGLQRGDIYLDADPPVIHVQHGKGDKDRIVPIHPTLHAHLVRRACWLYRPKAHQYRNPGWIGKKLKKALTIDGVKITAHQLRHYFGTEAAKWSGGNVVLVSQLMGHESMNTTMGYIKWSPAEGADVVSKIVTAGVDDELTKRRELLRAV